MEYYRRGYGTLNPIVITWTESIFSVLFITIFQCLNFFLLASLWLLKDDNQRFIVRDDQALSGNLLYVKNKVERRWTDFDGCQLQYILQKWDVYAWWNASRHVLCYRKTLCYFPFFISHYFIFRSNECWHFIQHRPLIYQEGVNQSLCFNNCIHEKKNTSIFIRLIDSFKKTNNNCIPKL